MGSPEIDFSDLEAKYAVSDDHSLNSFVVVDGAPQAPAAKVAALTKVLKKVLSSAGPLKEPYGFYMPTNEDGSTRGYVFLEFETEQAAKNCVKTFNGKKLDSKHTLLIDRLSNVARLLNEDIPSGESAAEEAKQRLGSFKPLPHLRAWLTDPQGRDQALFHVDDSVVISWIRKDVNPREVVRRHGMTETYTRWSPQGTYLLGLFSRGCCLFGGPDIELLGRIPHPCVRFVDFSPDERYLVTASDMPLPAVPEKPEARAAWPFKESDEGNHIVVWDMKTLTPVRTFPQATRVPVDPRGEPPARMGKSVLLGQLVGMENSKRVWPALKWSSDSKFFARIPAPNTLAVYETPSMALVNKKTIKLNGLQDIDFAPAPVDGKQLLAYWVPEEGSQTARMAILEVPSMQTVRNRSLFNVSNVRFYWQNEAKYLAIKVDRLNKNKKTAFSSLELYRMRDKGIPVEVIDLKEVVIDLAWEPRGSKIVVLSQQDVNGSNLSSSKSIVTFYALEDNKGPEGRWKEAYRFDRPANLILWSPAGRFVITGVIKGQTAKPSIEFWDTEQEGPRNQSSASAVGAEAARDASSNQDLPINLASLEKRDDNKFDMTDAAWDSAGGVLATWSSQWRNGVSLGYRLWSITGRTLRDERVDKFKSFMWRPRPPSLLTAEKKAEIQRNIKNYAAIFDGEDTLASLQETDELQRKLDKAIHSWISFRGRTAALLGEQKKVSPENMVRLVDGRPRVFSVELIEQRQEVVTE